MVIYDFDMVAAEKMIEKYKNEVNEGILCIYLRSVFSDFMSNLGWVCIES